jgi:ATP-dependent Clp protease ATP-binding subunit ClpA
VREAGYDVALAPEVAERLQAVCLTDLSNGGRGIRNQLEAHLVNPLARALFEHPADGPPLRVEAMETNATTTLHLAPAP